MHQDIVKDAALEQLQISIDNLARIFSLMLQEQVVLATKGKAYSTFATLGKDKDTNPKKKNKKIN